MRRQFLILAVLFSAAHLIVSFFLFAALFAAGMERFDHGGDPAPWERPADEAFAILTFPASLVYQHSPWRLTALFQNGLFILNSLLWGCAASWTVRLICRQVHRLTIRYSRPRPHIG